MRIVLIAALAALTTLACVGATETNADTRVQSIKGVPAGSNAINRRLKPRAEIGGFVVGKRDGQVGVSVEVNEGPCAFPDDCSHIQTIIFTFPQLRYDRATRRIMLGEQVGETRGFFRHKRNPGVNLTLKRTEKESTKTIRGSGTVVYELFLEAPAAAAETGTAQE